MLAGLTEVMLNYVNSLVFVSRLFRKSRVSHKVARAGGRRPDGRRREMLTYESGKHVSVLDYMWDLSNQMNFMVKDNTQTFLKYQIKL